MEKVITVTESEDSESSIIELEVPQRTPPPVIDIIEEEEQLILHVNDRESSKVISVSEFIKDFPSAEPSISQINYPYHWTSDMIKFYNDDWGGEDDFVVENIQSTMDKNPTLWTVSKKDMLMALTSSKSRRSIKCWNCMQYGHPYQKCREPEKVIVCHMCGEPGHKENNCPNSKCLNCGNQTKTYSHSCFKCYGSLKALCRRCNLRGHNVLSCSDNWRSYHITIDNKNPNVPNGCVNKPQEQLWCCNCGNKGHHQINCTRTKNLPVYPDSHPFVASYVTSFRQNYDNSSTSVNTFTSHLPKSIFPSGSKKGKSCRYFETGTDADNLQIISPGKVPHKERGSKHWKYLNAIDKANNKLKKKCKRKRFVSDQFKNSQDRQLHYIKKWKGKRYKNEKIIERRFRPNPFTNSFELNNPQRVKNKHRRNERENLLMTFNEND